MDSLTLSCSNLALTASLDLMLQVPSGLHPPKVAGQLISASSSSVTTSPSDVVSATKLSEDELTQYLCPVGLGPSVNTWPKCDPHFLQLTSVRIISGLVTSSRMLPPIPDASSLKMTLFLSSTSKNDGQPDPESYFVLDANNGSVQTLHP